MIFHTQTYQKKPYIMRVWRCTDYPEHWHSEIEIYICLQGSMRIRVEGVDYHLHGEDVLLIASNELHEIFCDCPDTQAMIIAFGYVLLGKDFDKMQQATFANPYFSLRKPAAAMPISGLVQQIREIFLNENQDGIVSDWKLRGKLYEVAACLYTWMQNTSVSQIRKARAKQLEKMYGVLDHISENYRQPITLEQAAAITGYDRSYFSKQFLSATGMTFHKYLNRYRLVVACRLLGDMNLSVSAVAERSGFSSQKMMNRIFRDVLGLTPTQYRRLPAEEKNAMMVL